MRKLITSLAALAALSSPAAAQSAAKGEAAFRKCAACHVVETPGGVKIAGGGKIGPNLFGVVGRQAGSQPGFRYGRSMVAAGQDGLVWDTARLAEYIQDPTGYLRKVTGDRKAKANMGFKLRDAETAADIAAFLAQHK